MSRKILILVTVFAFTLTTCAVFAQEESPYGVSIDQNSLDLLILAAARLSNLKNSPEFDQVLSVKAKIIFTDAIDTRYFPGEIVSQLPNIILDARIDIIKGVPDLIRVNLISNFGDMYVSAHGANATAVIPDQNVYAEGVIPQILPSIILRDDNSGLFTLINILGGIPFPSYIFGGPLEPGEGMEFVDEIEPEDLKAIIAYRGLDNTAAGLAHVISIRSNKYMQYIKVWLLKDSLDLYQISIEDERGTEAFVLLTEMGMTTPPSLTSFDLDTTGMALITPEELALRFLAKVISAPAVESPIVADFYLSHNPVALTGTVIASSDGIDLQDKEDQLLCEMQYKVPGGDWASLQTEYAGVAPVGHWNAEYNLPVDADLGKYGFRVRYIDTSGNVSEWSEYPDIMTATPAPSRIAQTVPKTNETDVLVTTKVMMTFTKPMNKKSVEDAFSMISSSGKIIKGAFEWNGDTIIFTPNDYLEYNTRHLVRLAGTAMDTENIGFDGNYDAQSDGLYFDDYVCAFTTATVSPMLALEPFSKSVHTGDFVDLKVAVKNVSALYKFSFKVAFESDQLEVRGIQKESFLSWRPALSISDGSDLWKNSVIDNEAGFVTFACDSTRSTGVSGSGNLATISFKCKMAGKLIIKFSEISMTDLDGNSIPLNIREAEISVIDYDPADINRDGIVDILDLVTDKDAVAAPYASKFDLANHPNPFNPETWIPYQLARPGDVTVKIYSATGEMVRALEIGYKQAGVYKDRDNSVYWDGKDESGQKVSSGIYFYAIKAGNFTATKKMLVRK